MNNKQKRSLVGIIILVIALIIIFVVVRSQKTTQNSEQSSVVMGETASEGITSENTKPAGSTVTKTGTLSRSDALIKYQNKLVRIDDSCTGEVITHSFNVPKGTRFMIDNDSDKAHTVIVEGRKVTLGARKYTTESMDNGGIVESICNKETGITTISAK